MFKCVARSLSSTQVPRRSNVLKVFSRTTCRCKAHSVGPIGWQPRLNATGKRKTNPKEEWANSDAHRDRASPFSDTETDSSVLEVVCVSSVRLTTSGRRRPKSALLLRVGFSVFLFRLGQFTVGTRVSLPHSFSPPYPPIEIHGLALPGIAILMLRVFWFA